MGLSQKTERALELCYDAIAAPQLWTGALDNLAHSLGAHACQILSQLRHRPFEIKNLEVNDMTQNSKLRIAALSMSFVTMATLAVLAQTGSAQAVSSLSQCSGPSRQDVLKVEPSAVSIGSDGYYTVDYDKLGIAMERIQ